MVLEKLGSALKKTLSKIANAIFLDKKVIEEIVKDLRRSLLEADVDQKIVSELCEKIKTSKEKTTLEKKDHLIKLIHDEIINILGKEKYELKLDKKKPCYIMLVGLYGSGKTTTAAKLALYYSKRGFKCCMMGLDVHRPAAPEQLEQLGKKIKIPYFINKKEKNPIKIWKEFKDKTKKFDLIFIDTAGRDAFDKSLINEIKKLSKEIKPYQTILVMPADIGQAAKTQATEFKKACDINKVIITRLDGTAKGGGALVACNETKANVIFIGTGEKPQDIETFNPSSFVGRLLGMGDIEALMEKAKLAVEKKTEEKIEKGLEEGKFTLLDLYEQLKSVQKMGPLSKITELIPGLGKMKLPEGMLETQEEKIKKWKYAIDSMTKEEIENPEIINTSRIKRIAKGAGINASDVRDLINQYKMIKKLPIGKVDSLDISKIQKGGLGLSQKQLRKLAKKFKGKLPF